MKIKNGMVFLPDKKFEQADLIVDRKITQIIRKGEGQYPDNREKEEMIDASGKYVVPGFVDIHSHGAAGADVSDGEFGGMKKMAEFYVSHGVTSWCPTTMALPEENLVQAVKVIREFQKQQEKAPGNMARCLGVHLEGPFLNKEKKGAQAEKYLREPDLKLFERLWQASGEQVQLITVAPEQKGALSFIKKASEYCTVSLGHSTADYETVCRAFEAGASHVTHLFNGMNGLHHREPGIFGAALEYGVPVELICDGLHIHPSVIRMIWKLYGDKISLISDSMRCAGMKDGIYDLGGQQVQVENGKALLPGGTLAGSSINLLDAVRNAVRFGIPLESAVYAATAAPAFSIGRQDEIGMIQIGNRADLLILDRELNLETVIIGGEKTLFKSVGV